MPRRKVIAKRSVQPDAKYDSELVSKFINHVMREGKKSVAERIIYKTLERLSSRLRGNALDLLEKALDNVRPLVEVKSRRVGGSTYQIPIDVRPVRRTALAIRWILAAAKKRSEKGMIERLVHELMDAIEGRGTAVKTKQDREKMAEANRAFANYRW